ncbi:MAG: hypothetical protein NTV02_03395 [Candidatus Zambryskibacteria bacterium]|nr:hypothetical protein [Candidatus Zambryskibacteria bacterium]
MEETPEKISIKNPETADAIAELQEALEGDPTELPGGFLKVNSSNISGGLRPVEDLIKNTKPELGVLEEQRVDTEREPVPVTTRRLPKQYYDEASHVLDLHIEGDKNSEAEAIDFFSRGRRSIEEFFEAKNIKGLTLRARDAQTRWKKVIEKLIDRDLIGDYGNGIYGGAALRGGSGGSEKEASPIGESESWIVPDDFRNEFERIQNANRDPGIQKDLDIFKHFGLDVVRTKEDLIKKLQDTKGAGTFTDKQYNLLLSMINREEREPASKVKEETVPLVVENQPQSPLVVEEEEDFTVSESFVDGIRSGAETWKNMNLEDKDGNKLPLTPESYIRSMGGVLSQKNINKVAIAFDTLVEQGFAFKTPQGYEIQKISRITKKESATEKASEVPESILLTLNNLGDRLSNAVPIRFLVADLKKPGVTKEQVAQLITASGVIDDEMKKSLIGMLTGASSESVQDQIPEAPRMEDSVAPELPEAPPVYIPWPQFPEPVPPPVYSPQTPDTSPEQQASLRYNKIADYLLSLAQDPESPHIFGLVAAYLRQEGLSERDVVFELSTLYNYDVLLPEQKKKIQDILDGNIEEEVQPEIKTDPELPLLEPIEPAIENKEGLDTQLRLELASARERYVAFEVEYRKKVKDGRKWYQNAMTTLGASGKTYPMPDKDPAHSEAEEEYFRAKWHLKNFILGKDTDEVPPENAEDSVNTENAQPRKINKKLTEQSESERRLAQNLIEDALSPKEKSELRKKMEAGLRVYNRLNPAARVAFNAAFITVGLVGLGKVTAGAAMGIGTVRLARGLVSLGTANVAGEAFDGIKRKKQEKIKEERQGLHEANVTAVETLATDSESDGNYTLFKEEERKQMDLDTEAARQEKIDRLKKAALMAVVGGAAAFGTGLAIDNVVPSGGGASALDKNKTGGNTPSPENIPKKTPSFMDRFLKKPPETQTQASIPKVTEAPTPKVSAPEKIIEAPVAEVTKAPVVPEALKTLPAVETPPVAIDIKGEVNVPLSSKGYIATIAELQEKLKGKPLSTELTALLQEPPEKIAIKLGLYKPDEPAESALGFKGDQITLDTQGNISLMRGDTHLDTLVKADGTISEYNGEMFDADPASPVETETVTPEPEAPKSSVVIEQKIPGTLAQTIEEIAVKDSNFTKITDMFDGKMPLKKEYQFGDQFKSQRVAYSKFFTGEYIKNALDLFDYQLAIPYQEGYIHAIQKGPDVTILLNGEKIGSGLIGDGKIGFQYESKLGKGIFGVKSEYEQAFAKAVAEVEKNKQFFKVNK